MTMIRRSLLTLAVAALICGHAVADPIPVANYSFEDPVLSEGGDTWTNAYPDWAPPPTAGDSFVEYIEGFAADGLQHVGVATGAEVSQNVGVQLLPNTIYGLTVAIGHREGFVDATGNASTFALYAGGDAGDGGALLVSTVVDAFPIPAGTFEDFSLIYETGPVPPAGDLYIALSSGGGNRGHFDNIRLNVIPEPSTLALSFAAALACWKVRRRRR